MHNYKVVILTVSQFVTNGGILNSKKTKNITMKYVQQSVHKGSVDLVSGDSKPDQLEDKKLNK